MTADCLLCRSAAPPFVTAFSGRYFRCANCDLVFRHPGEFPDAASERAWYDTHENAVDDPGYRRFLSRLASVLFPQLPNKACGLDFGCGPAPALVAMAREAGFDMHAYDPWFAPDERALDRRYDFVTCTETVEHFHDPLAGFATLDRLLAPAALLGVMTGWPPASAAEFERWHYHRDPTHVCFFSPACLAWLAAHFGWSAEFPVANVTLFRKPPG